ncbi:MAG: DsrE family protein [Gammaproteobacteria bacterium]
MTSKITALVCASCLTIAASAQNPDAFHNGTAIPSFGKVASVDSDMRIPKDAEFKVTFDVGKQADPGTINRTLDSAARFINMHVEAGVPKENIHVAVVVHGSASTDVTNDTFYQKKNEDTHNPNIEAIAALVKNNTDIYLCGQTAAYRGVTKDELVPGVKMALSAMTAHALLLQQGYTPNPF